MGSKFPSSTTITSSALYMEGSQVNNDVIFQIMVTPGIILCSFFVLLVEGQLDSIDRMQESPLVKASTVPIYLHLLVIRRKRNIFEELAQMVKKKIFNEPEMKIKKSH